MTAAFAPTAALAPQLFPVTSRARAALLVLGGALFTAASAQLSFYLPWTPVPVTGQTVAVLLVGTAFGARLGASAMVLYIAMGAIGLPFYSDGNGGWRHATGSTAGYLVGFVVAAVVVGALADRRRDRSVATALPSIAAGTAIIYAFGATWLGIKLNVGPMKAFDLGVQPFLAGDAMKIALLGLGLPFAWRLADPR